ncbi:DNA translocase FtsK [Nicoliella spurrieriana]|uniref:DNA translocase FtsK n=1 Tax=Nicoliella spurrieriana TaxID=2925830 RepID=A0A976X5H4_9LACO|nr:DNA translocase FtsK [Nicoliella spurrieriana]UQS86716.1 DNA translocase FtsK [Nicoliella spurrieriana]
MNHYDGPAFYRRFLQKPKANQDQASYSNNKMTHRTPIDSLNGNKTHRENFRTTGDHFQPQSENSILKLTQAFQPRGNYARRITGDEYLEESKLGRYYLKLIEQLDKHDSDCVLFDDGINTRANSDVIQFDDVDETSENRAAYQNDEPRVPQSEQPNAERFESAVAKMNQSSANDEVTAARLNAPELNSAPSDVAGGEPPKRSAATNSSGEARSRIARHRQSIAADSAASDSVGSASAAEELNANRANSSEAPKAKPQAKHGLGHSLSAILDNETDAQKDVEFFKDGVIEHRSTSASDSLTDSSHADGDSSSPQTVAAASDTVDAPASDESEHYIGPGESDPDHQTLSSGDQYSQGYQFPKFTMLKEPQRRDDAALDDWIVNQSEILDRTLSAFHVNAEVVDWTNGPTVTQFQVKLALGVKVSKITNLNDDLKLALAAKDIRIEAPIPGRTTVGVEIPNPKPRPVMLSEVLGADSFQQAKSPLTIALGVDLTGKPQVTDITKMPHGLIAGATGSGKSVFINSLLVSLLYKSTPADLRLLLIDPKAVELAPYNNIPHLLAPVISEPNEASAALKWAVKEMDERYEKLAAAGARNIEQFNQKAVESDQPQLKMPYIVIIIDELADLMMVASTEVQDYIVRITQKARAAGIHLIVATQRPSVDIVTGTIKNNIPTRIAFMVSSQVDSRTIIDTAGAERLLGRGDMLYLGNGKSQPLRLQGTFVTNEEIEQVTAAVRTQGTPQYAFNPKSLLKKVNMVQQQDDLMPEVLAYIAKEKTVSTSKLQRVFSIGYNRAATLIDDLEQQNYISGQHGSKPREVYLTEDDFKKLNL